MIKQNHSMSTYTNYPAGFYVYAYLQDSHKAALNAAHNRSNTLTK